MHVQNQIILNTKTKKHIIKKNPKDAMCEAWICKLTDERKLKKKNYYFVNFGTDTWKLQTANMLQMLTQSTNSSYHHIFSLSSLIH